MEEIMKEFSYTIRDKVGIHARPAGLLVKLAKEFKSDIYIEKGDKRVKADKLIAIMSLGIKQGDTVNIYVSGDDEEDAVKAIHSFLEANL